MAGLTVAVGGMVLNHYQGIQHRGSKELKRPAELTMLFGLVVLAGAIATAILSFVGAGSTTVGDVGDVGEATVGIIAFVVVAVAFFFYAVSAVFVVVRG